MGNAEVTLSAYWKVTLGDDNDLSGFRIYESVAGPF